MDIIYPHICQFTRTDHSEKDVDYYIAVMDGFFIETTCMWENKCCALNTFPVLGVHRVHTCHWSKNPKTEGKSKKAHEITWDIHINTKEYTMIFVITVSTSGSCGAWETWQMGWRAWDFLFLYWRRMNTLCIEELVTHKALIAGEVPNHYSFSGKGIRYYSTR